MVSEVEEPFLPLPSSLLFSLTDHRAAVERFLDALPASVAATKNVETCTLNALKFAGKLLEDCGGKLLLFQASLPSCGEGKLKVRETPVAAGEGEKDLLSPGSPLYRELATALVDKQVSIDVFAGAAQYADVATLSSLCIVTGGQFFFYPAFHGAGPLAEALYGDIFHDLTRETGFEAVLRVRVPQGARVAAFHGNFTLTNTDLMVAPVCHADTTAVLEFAIESTLAMPAFPIQSALLYTNARGERRIRVHTLSLPVSNVLAHLFERVNQDVVAAVALHQGASSLPLSHSCRRPRAHRTRPRPPEAPPALSPARQARPRTGIDRRSCRCGRPAGHPRRAEPAAALPGGSFSLLSRR